MCGINVCIGGRMADVRKMYDATSHRGTADSYRAVELSENRIAWVNYNHLPITTQSQQRSFETENYIVWMNGFISNHKELAEKHGFKLNTICDTEVLANVLQYGIGLDELNGFFAVFYYCKRTKVIGSFTDRYGIKQLYEYIDEKGVQYISSEVKGILAVVNPELCEFGVDDWKTTLGVMNNDTIYKGIKRVPSLSVPWIERSTDTSIEAYEKAKNQLIGLLKQSIERNKYNGNDGVYLSGGIDSGLLAKWIEPEYTFSVDYVDDNYSEIELIKENSKSKHYSVIINKDNYMDFAERSLLALDDFKAGSCYSNFAAAELASKFVKVVYSGAGGDEFFGGYPHRLDKTIPEIVKRTKQNCWLDVENYVNCEITHFEYDLKFLRAVLVVEDRMTAFHTMECRYPLLDNDVVNFALSLPLEFIENKRILKDVCGLSENVIKGKKRGFSNPYFTNDEWVDFTLKSLKK